MNENEIKTLARSGGITLGERAVIMHIKTKALYRVLGLTRVKVGGEWHDAVAYIPQHNTGGLSYTRLVGDFGGFSAVPEVAVSVGSNGKVSVKLNDDGRQLLNTISDGICLSNPRLSGRKLFPQDDENGWSRWVLWDFMHTFGPHLSLGSPTYFDEMRVEP